MWEIKVNPKEWINSRSLYLMQFYYSPWQAAWSGPILPLNPSWRKHMTFLPEDSRYRWTQGQLSLGGRSKDPTSTQEFPETISCLCTQRQNPSSKHHFHRDKVKKGWSLRRRPQRSGGSEPSTAHVSPWAQEKAGIPWKQILSSPASHRRARLSLGCQGCKTLTDLHTRCAHISGD